MIVVSIGSDRKIFEEGSAARARMVEYGSLFDELHIIIFSRSKDKLQPKKISENVWIYPTNSWSRIFYPFDARRVYKRVRSTVKPQVVSAQDPFEAGLAAVLIRRLAKAKLHIQIHTDFMSKFFVYGVLLNRVRMILARWILPKADAVRAVSQRIKSSLAAIDEKLLARTMVLPIYTDIEKFRIGAIHLDLRKKYPQFSYCILIASRLTYEKNIALALKVMQRIVTKDKHVGMVIVGDGPEREYLRALALRYSVDHNVVFEPWQSDLVSYYKSADLFLLTSLYEGYGLTLIEAFASGCPIISSDVGIAKEVITSGENGYICPVLDGNAFAEKIMSIIENSELREQLKQQAILKAKELAYMSKDEYHRQYKLSLEQALRT